MVSFLICCNYRFCEQCQKCIGKEVIVTKIQCTPLWKTPEEIACTLYSLKFSVCSMHCSAPMRQCSTVCAKHFAVGICIKSFKLIRVIGISRTQQIASACPQCDGKILYVISWLSSGSDEGVPFPGFHNLQIWPPSPFTCGVLWELIFTFHQYLQPWKTWRIECQQYWQISTVFLAKYVAQSLMLCWCVLGSLEWCAFNFCVTVAFLTLNLCTCWCSL